jgi:cell division protein FtsI/penicillin-binding protein 2
MILLLAALTLSAEIGSLDPLLARRFPSSEISYLVMDLRSRDVIASRWTDPHRAIPVGSLVKPFTALAHAEKWPALTCDSRSCWYAKGHGVLRFREALAQSCNSYFLQLSAHVERPGLHAVAARFALPMPSKLDPPTLIGEGTAWQISPLALVNAYCELETRRAEPRISEILTGMELAATIGTARAVGAGALAKTGTAPCISERRHAGDGFVVTIAPAESPRFALLVRVHGVPGATAAKPAREILRAILEGK